MTKYMLTTLALATCLVGASATAQNSTSAVRLAVREDSKRLFENAGQLPIANR